MNEMYVDSVIFVLMRKCDVLKDMATSNNRVKEKRMAIIFSLSKY